MTATTGRPPYEQLYIYEVDGDLRAHLGRPGQGYLGLWLEDQASYLFFSRPARNEVSRLCAAAGLNLLADHQLTYDQWQGGQDLAPLELDGLAVVPAWLDYDPSPGDAPVPLVRLDPGLVFGSGFHPTTQHCLELLLELAGRRPLGGVLDLGCGTGILACAAAALGAGHVTAVDLNPLCVSTTRANAELNRLDITVYEGSAPDFAARPAETLLSNLHWEVQEQVLADPAALKGKRDLILSGLMRSQRPLVEERLTALGYHITARREAEFTWFTVAATAE